MKKIILPISLLVLLGFIWGSGYVIAKYATMHGVSPFGYSFWQSLGPAVFLFILALKKKAPLNIKQPRFVGFYFVCGALGIAFPNTNMYFAAPHLPPGLIALMVNTVPIMIYPIAMGLKLERFNLKRVLGVLLGVAGLFVILFPHRLVSPEHIAMPWLFMLLLTPLSFALCAIFISKFRPKGSDSLSLSAGMLITSTILLVPFVVVLKKFYPLCLPLNLADGAVILEIVLSSIGYVIFFELLKIAGPVYYSLVGGVVALTGLFWGWLFYNEVFTPLIIIAIVLIIVGIAAVSLCGQKANNNK